MVGVIDGASLRFFSLSLSFDESLLPAVLPPGGGGVFRLLFRGDLPPARTLLRLRLIGVETDAILLSSTKCNQLYFNS